MVGLLAQGRRRQLEAIGANIQERQDAPDRALDIADELLVGELQRRNPVRMEELAPMGILGLAAANEGVDRLEVEVRLACAPGIVGDPARIGPPPAGLLGSIMRDGARNLVRPREANIAQAGKTPVQALEPRSCRSALGR